MGVAEGDQPEPKGASGRPPSPATASPPPRPFRLEHLLLLDNLGSEPLPIDALGFAGNGIGVIRRNGEQPRVLPWSSVTGCVVERWDGGVIPEWWVDPELNGRRPEPVVGSVTDPRATTRSLPHTDPGAVIGVRTPNGTFRFLVADGDPVELARLVDGFTLRRAGPAGVSSVTRVVAWGTDAERRKAARPAPVPTGWIRIRPYLVAVLIALVILAATLILLQSAGTIHLPVLGGPGSGPGEVLRSP